MEDRSTASNPDPSTLSAAPEIASVDRMSTEMDMEGQHEDPTKETRPTPPQDSHGRVIATSSDVPSTETPAHNIALDSSASASEAVNPTTEVNENDQERPVREALKKTSIGTLPRKNEGDASDERADNGSSTMKTISNDSDMSEVSTATATAGNTSPHFPQNGHVIGDKGDEPKSTDTEDQEKEVGGDEDRPGTAAPLEETLADAEEEEPPVLETDKSMEEASSPRSQQETPRSGSPQPLGEDGPLARAMSPRTKRSRDQFDKDLEKEDRATAAEEVTANLTEEVKRETSQGPVPRTTRDEPEKKRHRDISQDATSKPEAAATKIPSSSGFANTSAISPFGSIGASNIQPSSSSGAGIGDQAKSAPRTSSSGFAASGFGALAGLSGSPFGALGSSGASAGFGKSAPSSDGLSSSNPAILDPQAPALLGGAFSTPNLSAASPFGSSASPFGGLGGSFGGGFGQGGKALTSFASKDGPSIIGSSQATTSFGAPEGEEDHDEEDDEEDDGDESGVNQETKEERKFHHQEIETGEEGEETRFSARAKLYHFDTAASAWKERGYGTLKLNVSSSVGEGVASPSAEESAAEEGAEPQQPKPKMQARLLMRSDGVYRVLLNVPIFETFKAGDKDGNVPSDRQVLFAALHDSTSMAMCLKLNNNSTASELWRQIMEVKEEL